MNFNGLSLKAILSDLLSKAGLSAITTDPNYKVFLQVQDNTLGLKRMYYFSHDDHDAIFWESRLGRYREVNQVLCFRGEIEDIVRSCPFVKECESRATFIVDNTGSLIKSPPSEESKSSQAVTNAQPCVCLASDLFKHGCRCGGT